MTTSGLSKSRLALFIVLAAIGCFLDLATKTWIFGKYGTQAAAGPDPIVLIPGVFGLTTTGYWPPSSGCEVTWRSGSTSATK